MYLFNRLGLLTSFVLFAFKFTWRIHQFLVQCGKLFGERGSALLAKREGGIRKDRSWKMQVNLFIQLLTIYQGVVHITYFTANTSCYCALDLLCVITTRCCHFPQHRRKLNAYQNWNVEGFTMWPHFYKFCYVRVL